MERRLWLENQGLDQNKKKIEDIQYVRKTGGQATLPEQQTATIDDVKKLSLGIIINQSLLKQLRI